MTCNVKEVEQLQVISFSVHILNTESSQHNGFQEIYWSTASTATIWWLLFTTPPPQPFYGPLPGPPGWAGARRELLDFMVQRKINRGSHTDHPAGRHSIRTNQCSPPPSPIFLQAGCPSCRPTNSVKALKATASIPNAVFKNILSGQYLTLTL